MATLSKNELIAHISSTVVSGARLKAAPMREILLNIVYLIDGGVPSTGGNTGGNQNPSPSNPTPSNPTPQPNPNPQPNAGVGISLSGQLATAQNGSYIAGIESQNPLRKNETNVITVTVKGSEGRLGVSATSLFIGRSKMELVKDSYMQVEGGFTYKYQGEIMVANEQPLTLGMVFNDGSDLSYTTTVKIEGRYRYPNLEFQRVGNKMRVILQKKDNDEISGYGIWQLYDNGKKVGDGRFKKLDGYTLETESDVMVFDPVQNKPVPPTPGKHYVFEITSLSYARGWLPEGGSFVEETETFVG